MTRKKALVIGLGESGLAMARWLVREGAAVRVADSRKNPPNQEALAALPGVELIAGAFETALFSDVDLVALSPGVSRKDLPPVPAPVPVVSEIELFAAGVRARAPQSRIIAITGSNGKTTTTALTAHLLNAAGLPAVACGNISPSALDALMAALDSGASPRFWVLEVSSFQLETTQNLDAAVATLLNVSEDHLDRYGGDLACYAQAKSRVFQGCALRVLNRDDPVSAACEHCGQCAVTFGLDAPPLADDYGLVDEHLCRGKQPLIALSELSLSGRHNAANALAALALCEAVGLAPARALPALKHFKGLPHRTEKVADIGGVLYVDDSKGTNVGASLAAIEGMGRPVAVILGGDGKGQDFSPLRAALETHGRAVALLGRDAAKIESAIAGTQLPMKRCDNMDQAVAWLAAQARPGDCVLLSPACSSLDMYADYAARAGAFIAAVEGLSS